MKLVRVHRHGGAEVLELEESEVPRPGPGQALLRIEATGVNFVEIYHRTGLYKLPLPFILGNEAAGTIEAIGPGVTTVRPGDRVASLNVLGVQFVKPGAVGPLEAYLRGELDLKRLISALEGN